MGLPNFLRNFLFSPDLLLHNIFYFQLFYVNTTFTINHFELTKEADTIYYLPSTLIFIRTFFQMFHSFDSKESSKVDIIKIPM